MQSETKAVKYVAFLRGINVGGHHKVPMAELREELEQMGFENIITILNSGNVIFDGTAERLENIEKKISVHLENHFGFPVPTILRKSETILEHFNSDPFKAFVLTKESRFYISLLKKEVQSTLKIPWESPDKSFKIIDKKSKDIFSVLDLSASKTPKAMEVLEERFGKATTTRNWNTILRIVKKLEAMNG